MTTQQEKFCISYVATRDVKMSALEAGYSESYATSKAYLLPSKLKEHIDYLESRYYKSEFKKLSLKAMNTLKEIIVNSNNESAQLSACKYVLEHAGITEHEVEGLKITIRLPDELRD